jgi:hypothetical protein
MPKAIKLRKVTYLFLYLTKLLLIQILEHLLHLFKVVIKEKNGLDPTEKLIELHSLIFLLFLVQ